jgi:superfamily II DNA or RNA helicase
MLNDFADYSNRDPAFLRQIHTIFAGQEKNTSKKIVISTWQSIFRESESFFDSFDGVFGDECHLFKSKSLTSLLRKMKNTPFRIATTGTLDNTQAHKLIIEGLFGRSYSVTTTKTLIDNNILSQLTINNILLKYAESSMARVRKAKYADEIEWIISNKERNDFISNLACNIKGNVLVLFNYVERHGIPLYEQIKNKNIKDTFMINGKTDIEQRELIRNIVNKHDNSVLVASYGTCSTGINIKNIHAIIFASPSKSVVRVLQSIGRGLRKSDTKDKVVVYDLGDDLRYKSYRNHTLRHMDERLAIYNKEKFNYKVVNVRLGEP